MESNLRAIITNVQSHGFGGPTVLWNRLCSFCVQRIETILLLFCFCPVVDQFWNEFFYEAPTVDSICSMFFCIFKLTQKHTSEHKNK